MNVRPLEIVRVINSLLTGMLGQSAPAPLPLPSRGSGYCPYPPLGSSIDTDYSETDCIIHLLAVRTHNNHYLLTDHGEITWTLPHLRNWNGPALMWFQPYPRQTRQPWNLPAVRFHLVSFCVWVSIVVTIIEYWLAVNIKDGTVHSFIHAWIYPRQVSAGSVLCWKQPLEFGSPWKERNYSTTTILLLLYNCAELQTISLYYSLHLFG